jgi:hypothetical protein
MADKMTGRVRRRWGYVGQVRRRYSFSRRYSFGRQDGGRVRAFPKADVSGPSHKTFTAMQAGKYGLRLKIRGAF